MLTGSRTRTSTTDRGYVPMVDKQLIVSKVLITPGFKNYTHKVVICMGNQGPLKLFLQTKGGPLSKLLESQF